MSVSNPRSRIVCVRLSVEEYEGLKDLCLHHGERSVSEAARRAMRLMMHPQAGGSESIQELSGRLRQMDGRLATLDREVSRLTELCQARRAQSA